MLSITEDEIIKCFNSYFGQLSKGNLQSDSLRNSMHILYIKMRRKRTTQKLNHHTKASLDKHIYKILRLIFLQMHQTATLKEESEEGDMRMLRDVAGMIYEMETDTDDGTAMTNQKIDKFIEKLIK
jgi:hypothetical protein